MKKQELLDLIQNNNSETTDIVEEEENTETTDIVEEEGEEDERESKDGTLEQSEDTPETE